MAKLNSKEQLITDIDDILGWGTVTAPFIVLLFFSPFNLDYFGLPKLVMLILLTLFLSYLQIRRWLTAGSIDIPIQASNVMAGIIVLVVVITAFLSGNPLASIIGRFNRYESIPGLICYMAIFWFAFKNARSTSFIKRFIPVFMGAFAVVNLYGLLEVFGFDMLHSPFQTEGRLSSTLGNPVFFGSFLAMSIPLLLAKGLFPSQDDKQPWDSPAVVFGLLCLGVAMLFSTMSRGAWLGALAGSSVVAYQKLKIKKQSRGEPARRNYWLLLIVAGVILGIAFSASINSGTSRVFDMAKTSSSLESRIEIWKSSLPMIADKPLSGYGLGQTNDWFNKYTTIELARIENSFNDRAHNIYLQMTIDGGLLLLLIQLWLIIYVITKIVAKISAKVSAPIIAVETNKDAHVLEHGDNHIVIGLLGVITGYLIQGLSGIATNDLSVFFWFTMGSATGLATTENVYTLRGPVGRVVILRVAVISALLLLAIAAITPLIIEARYFALSDEADKAMSDSALEQAGAISRYCAVQPYYQWNLANVFLDFASERDDPHYAKLAITPIQRGLRYNPEYPQFFHALGRAYLISARYSRDKHDLDLAERYLNQAREKAPLFLGTYVDLLELYMQQRNYNKVVTYAEFMRTIDDNSMEALAAESAVYQIRGDKAKAEELLSRASRVNRNARGMERALLELTKEPSVNNRTNKK